MWSWEYYRSFKEFELNKKFLESKGFKTKSMTIGKTYLVLRYKNKRRNLWKRNTKYHN